MTRTRFLWVIGGCAAFLAAGPAHAGEDFELWLNPSISYDLDSDTAVKLETAQRFRSAGNDRVDTYFARAWLSQRVAQGLTLSGAVERRVNDGGNDETRLMQQLTTSHGILRTRLRLEQRFVDNRDGRMGLRLRPRAGVAIPVTDRLSFGTDAELFWTLRGTSPGGDTGITGLRTQAGFDYAITENLEIGLTYLRQQDFEDNGPDEIGHAPLIGVEFAF
ncbi:DUF2490 domain-containing protein [Aurantiacibacter hainanensis]|uniref:DUF2490 domain-containing protein n=1 Tax=Aurantiacibacter hainanensis TaxID=3076114 RepID=UPI0030C68B36